MIARWLGWVAFAAGPVPAHAHSPVPGIEGFYTGLLHPFSTPSQFVLMLGLGLMIGGFEPLRSRWPLGVFVTAVVGGLIAGAGLEQPDAAMLAIAFAACTLSALAPGRLLPAAVAVAAVGGICIGVVSLADPGQLRDRVITTFGAVVGAAVGLLCISGFAAIVRERFSWSWTPIAFRILAAWVGAVSLIMLALFIAQQRMA